MLISTIQLKLVPDGVEFEYHSRKFRRIMKVGIDNVFCERLDRCPSEPQYTDLPERCDVEVSSEAMHKPRPPLPVPLSTVPDCVTFTIDGMRHQRIKDVGYGMILCQVIDPANHVFRQVTMRSELEVILESDVKLNPPQKSQLESPDDWVTQDRVPERVGIDQWRFVYGNSRPSEWETSNKSQTRYNSHGDVVNNCVCELRCRRKDLPPLPEPQHSDNPVQIPMAGGKAASSVGPPFHLIPTSALTHLANRFQKGVERKGDKSWNALSNNQECLTDKEFVIERMSHVIHHALKLRDQLQNGVQPTDESMTENAAAMAWGGVFAICAAEAIEKASK